MDGWRSEAIHLTLDEAKGPLDITQNIAIANSTRSVPGPQFCRYFEELKGLPPTSPLIISETRPSSATLSDTKDKRTNANRARGATVDSRPANNNQSKKPTTIRSSNRTSDSFDSQLQPVF